MKQKVLFILAVVMCFSNLYGQLLHKVASLDIYDDHIHNIFATDSLLFILRADWNNVNGFSVNIYNISEPAKPRLIGKQQKEMYEGESDFQGRVVFIKNSGFQYPFYVILSDDKSKAIHFFWYPNKVIESNEYFYEFRSFDSNVRIHQALSATEFQQIKSYPMSASTPVFTGLNLIEDVIYVITQNAGVILLDVADIDSINELTNPITGGNFVRIMSGNHKVWLENDTGVIIELDGSNPKQPEITRTISDTGFHLVGFLHDDKFYLKGDSRIVILDSDFTVENTIAFRKGIFVDSFIKIDSLLAVSSTSGIDIYNLTHKNISHLSRIGKDIGEAFHFEKRGALLFIADFAEGLTIVDVTDVRQPKLLSRYYLNGNARDVRVCSTYAYVADYINGLVILDISRPEKPEVVSSLKIEDGAKSLDLMEETAFIATNKWSLIAIAITNKLAPEILHQHIINAVYTWDEFWVDDNVVFAGNYVWSYFNDSPLFVHEYDSSNGFIQKVKFGNDPTDWGWGNEIKAFNNLLYFSTETGIRVLNNNTLDYVIKDPGFASGMEWSPEAVTLNGDMLYVSMGYFGVSGIEAYNMKDPQHPIKLEDGLGLGFAPQEMIFEDNYLFILTPAGIGIYSPDDAAKVNEKNNLEPIEPAAFHLDQNYPNPFNANTSINYMLLEPGIVSLYIYNVEGKKVRKLIDDYELPGMHRVKWDGRDASGKEVSSGVYLYQLKAGERMVTCKMLLVK